MPHACNTRRQTDLVSLPCISTDLLQHCQDGEDMLRAWVRSLGKHTSWLCWLESLDTELGSLQLGLCVKRTSVISV